MELIGLYGGMAGKPRKSHFFLPFVSLVSISSRRRFGSLLVWMLFFGGAWHPGAWAGYGPLKFWRLVGQL